MPDEKLHDEIITDKTPKSWTPKYSPVYKGAGCNYPTFFGQAGSPHLLPPPPSHSRFSDSCSGGRTPRDSWTPGGRTPQDPRTPKDLPTPAVSSSTEPAGVVRKLAYADKQPSEQASTTPSARSRAPPGATPTAQGTYFLDGRSPCKRGHGLPAVPSLRDKAKPPRIDAACAPRPAQRRAPMADGRKFYDTTQYHVPPAYDEVCTVVDAGSCSCEFMRCAASQVPMSSSIANITHIPLAVMCQPFAELAGTEAPVPLIDSGEKGPFRCPRCKAYANAFFEWGLGGREATCNFCEYAIPIEEDFRCALDHSGKRRDLQERPELQFGCVDYIAPRDYSEEQLPSAPVAVLVVETSAQAIRSGFVTQVANTLRQLLESRVLQAPASRVALITFDKSISFYAFHPDWEAARRLTVADIDDPFIPCSHLALCGDVDDSVVQAQFDQLLSALPAMLAAGSAVSGNSPESAAAVAGGSALKVATELAAAAGGGHVIMCHASLANAGLGVLLPRDDIKLYGDEAGRGLLKPQRQQLFDDLGHLCNERGVAVSVVCAPPAAAYVDVATLSTLPRRTGGDVCYLPGFCLRFDGETLHYNLSRMLVQDGAYSCVLKLRCSKGLAVRNSLHAASDGDCLDHSMFHTSRMSADATVIFDLIHTERLEGRKSVFLQVACLHTDKRGRRLLRVQTLKLAVTGTLSNVFRYADMDVVCNLLLKRSAASALAGDGGFRERLTTVTTDILYAYRANCASLSSRNSPQLILPEAFKLLPLFAQSIRKMAAFRSTSGVRIDERVATLVRLLQLPPACVSTLLYPRVYQLAPRVGLDVGSLVDAKGDAIHLPPSLRCSAESMTMDRIYLVDSGLELQIYIRQEVPMELVQDFFGEDIQCIDEAQDVISRWAGAQPEDLEVEGFPEEGCRVFAVCQQIRRERCRLPWLPINVVLPGTAEEARLLGMMVEDPAAREMSYLDYLIQIHELVKRKME
eukprot:TRINITY_DN14213_c0_g1_i3.p1 TRINITY_DN14213_c0_g1~~TRINITY_DN14213_c0_g1_i3.p1  ORF type:complete len:1098 (-),score=159.58 TRINITY_DN14213_c0_g1_i3:373-3288(-)